ncbi:XRE family transcriptional regulator [Gardnerella vaginalis]|nr:XRE family transcriptional regulator [Gardnerella vaginalis]
MTSSLLTKSRRFEDESKRQRMLDAKSAAIKTQEEASILMRETVRILRNQGLTVCDVAELTGVTPQRISSLKS